MHDVVISPLIHNIAIQISSKGDKETWTFSENDPSNSKLINPFDDAIHVSLPSEPLLLVPTKLVTSRKWNFAAQMPDNTIDFDDQERFKFIIGDWVSVPNSAKNYRVMGTLSKEEQTRDEIKHYLEIIFGKLSSELFDFCQAVNCLCALKAKHVHRELFSSVVEKKDSALSDVGISNFKMLSQFEIEILILITQGLTNPEIARKLLTTPATVRNSTSEIYSLIHAKNRAHAASIAATWISNSESQHQTNDRSARN
jgi:DNA-binding CsgD family transcriptional regulator